MTGAALLSKIGELLMAVWSTTVELSPWLLLGMAVAGALHVALPQGFVRRHLGHGRAGVLKSVLLGIPLPLCSCGVIPAGVGLRQDGASRGSAVGFLIATPQTGVDSVLVSASFLGWPFALFKVATALVTGVVGGLLTDAVTDQEPVPPPAATPEEEGGHQAGGVVRWRRGLDHAVEILASIWRWVVFGVVASAAIEVFLPAHFISGLADGPWAFLGVLVIALPLYICATASVPIAAALVSQGLPAGAALVFLLAGPATNLATMGAIRRTFGGRTLAVYLGTIVVGSIAFGAAFDFILPGAADVAALAHDHGAAPWWAWGSALVFVGLLSRFALLDLIRLAKAHSLQRRQSITLSVDGMTCNGCVRKLETALSGLDGVDGLVVTRNPGTVTVQGRVVMDAVAKTIESTGFRVAS